MATILSMPKWGLAMKTGQVVVWLKHPGDAVQQGEPIVQIESEKAVNEVEAPITGVLRWIEVKEGDDAPVSAAIAVITEPGEELSDEQIQALLREEAEVRRQKAEALNRPRASARSTESARTGREAGITRAPGERINASPAARRLAQELGVDLATVAGTGPKGMIGREDVLRAAEEAGAGTGEAEENTIDVAGVAIHYLVAGPTNAPHVLFVHGLGGSLTSWSLNLPAFADKFRICALDLVGAGSSDKPDRDYSVTALADFLIQFLDALGPDWQEVHIVGHSLGGAVALDVANRHQQRVQRLVLIDSAGLGLEIDDMVLHLMRSQPDRERIRTELASFFASADLVQRPLVEQNYQQRTMPGAHAALVATANAAFSDGQQQIDLRDAFERFPEPLLLIWGIEDHVIPVTHAQQVNASPLHRIEVLPDCGHCPHIEQSETFNRLVLSFLSEL